MTSISGNVPDYTLICNVVYNIGLQNFSFRDNLNYENFY